MPYNLENDKIKFEKDSTYFRFDFNTRRYYSRSFCSPHGTTEHMAL